VEYRSRRKGWDEVRILLTRDLVNRSEGTFVLVSIELARKSTITHLRVSGSVGESSSDLSLYVLGKSQQRGGEREGVECGSNHLC
jgi:hypothetical protein